MTGRVIGGNSFESRCPSLTPVIFFNLITGMIDTFKHFSQAYIMIEGGPRNQSLFFTYYLFQKGFEQYQMGYASAMAVVVFLIIMALTLLVFRWSKAWGFYEGELTGSNQTMAVNIALPAPARKNHLQEKILSHLSGRGDIRYLARGRRVGLFSLCLDDLDLAEDRAADAGISAYLDA